MPAIEKGRTYVHAGDKYPYIWVAEHDAADGGPVELYRTRNFSADKIVLNTSAGDFLTEVCGESVPEGGRSPLVHTCGKKIKDEHLCGVHLGAKKRAEAKRAKWLAESQASSDAENTARTALRKAGISGKAYFSHVSGKYTGDVVIKAEDLERLAALARTAD